VARVPAKVLGDLPVGIVGLASMPTSTRLVTKTWSSHINVVHRFLFNPLVLIDEIEMLQGSSSGVLGG
jgi:hypothetical protein